MSDVYILVPGTRDSEDRKIRESVYPLFPTPRLKVIFGYGFRGSALLEFISALKYIEAPAFIRLSGDNPLVDPAIIDLCVTQWFAAKPDIVASRHDLYGNTATYPPGYDVEVVNRDAFLFRTLTGIAPLSPYDLEHVTSWLYRLGRNHFLRRPACLQPLPENFSVTVDTPEDFERVKAVRSAFDVCPTYQEALGWFRQKESALQTGPIPTSSGA